MKARVFPPPTKTRCSTEGIAVQEERMVYLPLDYFFPSSAWVSLISGHKLIGPSVNQSSWMTIAAKLRSWTLQQFICMTGSSGTTAHDLWCKTHFFTSKQRSTVPRNSEVILLSIFLLFVQFLYIRRLPFFFYWDCLLLILKSATKDNKKRKQRFLGRVETRLGEEQK